MAISTNFQLQSLSFQFSSVQFRTGSRIPESCFLPSIFFNLKPPFFNILSGNWISVIFFFFPWFGGKKAARKNPPIGSSQLESLCLHRDWRVLSLRFSSHELDEMRSTNKPSQGLFDWLVGDVSRVAYQGGREIITNFKNARDLTFLMPKRFWGESSRSKRVGESLDCLRCWLVKAR